MLPNEVHSPLANLKESTEHLPEPECCGTTVAFKNALQVLFPSYSIQAATPYILLNGKRIFYCSESFQHCKANLTNLISKYASLNLSNLPPGPKSFFSSPHVKCIFFLIPHTSETFNNKTSGSKVPLRFMAQCTL